MNIFQRLRQKIFEQYTNTAVYNVGGGYKVERSTDSASLVNHCKDWVYVCASKNAETIAGCRIMVYAAGGTQLPYPRRSVRGALGNVPDGSEEITAMHPLVDLLSNPNPAQTMFEVMEYSILYQEITGDFYWYLEFDPKTGLPKYIYPLMSQYVTVVPAADGTVQGYLYGARRDKSIALGADEVLHIKYPNPKNPYYGLSPLEGAFSAASILESQNDYELSVYDNQAIPSAVMISKSRVTEEQRRQIETKWRQKYSGVKRAGGFALLEGDADLKVLSPPPRDTGIALSQKFAREEIAGAFGVPMTILTMSDSNRASAEAGNYAYLTQTIRPKLERLAAMLTEKLAQQYFDSRLYVTFENPVPDDVETEYRLMQMRVSLGITTVNEERERLGLAPLPESEPESEPEETEEPKTETETDDDMDEETEDEAEGNKKYMKRKRRPLLRQVHECECGCGELKQIAAKGGDISQIEVKFTDILAGEFARFGKEAINNLEAIGDGITG